MKDEGMATKIAFQLIPLEAHLARPSFDLSKLPFVIMPSVEVADPDRNGEIGSALRRRDFGQCNSGNGDGRIVG